MEVKERSTHYLSVELLDKTGALAAPTAVSYSIWCMTTGTEVRASTAVTPASSFELTLTPSDCAIVNSGNVVETKRVTVVAQYGGSGDQAVEEYDYVVRNVRALA